MSNETGLQSVTERFQQKCYRQFGSGIELPECYEVFKTIIDLEATGVSNCFPESDLLIEHNSGYYSVCSSFDHLMTKWILPILFIFCYSNIFTFLIYRLPYFDGSCSVNFLRVKAIANFIFVQSRIFEIIHAWTYEPNSTFENIYWMTKPAVITVANISGTISTWLTLLVTIETAICVCLPYNFRQLCTRKTTSIALCSCILTSILLHTIFFLTHTIKPVVSVSIKWLNEQYMDIPSSVLNSNSTESRVQNAHCYYVFKVFTMQLNPILFYEVLEKFYYWSQTVFSIIFPTLLMLACSVLIVTKFSFKNLGESFSQRRKCIIRLTISTTLSHLLLEGPALLTFSAAAIKGSQTDQHNTTMCILNNINNLLSIVNATIPFFVFLICNEQFRNMSTIYIKAQTEFRREKRSALLAIALNGRNRAGSGSQIERSFAGQALMGKMSNF